MFPISLPVIIPLFCLFIFFRSQKWRIAHTKASITRKPITTSKAIIHPFRNRSPREVPDGCEGWIVVDGGEVAASETVRKYSEPIFHNNSSKMFVMGRLVPDKAWKGLSAIVRRHKEISSKCI